MKLNKKDEGVTSVVGEMLLIALVLILVSLFAASAFNLLPGERDTIVDVSMNINKSSDPPTLEFWHKGGDWVDGDELTIILTPITEGERVPFDKNNCSLTDCFGNEAAVFDLGGCYAVDLSGVSSNNYSIRLTTADSVIYAMDKVKIKDGRVIP